MPKKQPEEDYPDQRLEFKLEEAVQKAVMAADRIILNASDGSVEQTDFLTMQVTMRFVEKVSIGIASKHRAYRLRERDRIAQTPPSHTRPPAPCEGD